MTTSSRECRAKRKAEGLYCLDFALRYRNEFGWSILALCPPDHMGVGVTHTRHCTSPGKAPWGPWKEFQDRLPTQEEIKRKWHDNPTLNVGVALGPVSGLIRVDVDGPEGEARLIQVSGGVLPPTLEFVSGRSNGGRGLLYAIPPGAELRTTVERSGAAKQELRFQAKGAQTVLPPSRHREGGLYAWTPGHGPWEIKADTAPDWLLDQLKVGKSVRATGGTPRLTQSFAIGSPIFDGARNSTLTSIAGAMRRIGCSVEAMYAALAIENKLRCKPPLDEAEVRVIAESIGRYPPSARVRLPETVRAQLEV